MENKRPLLPENKAYLTLWSCSSLVREATPPGRSSTRTENLTSLPSAANPLSRHRPSTVVSMLPPHNITTTLEKGGLGKETREGREEAHLSLLEFQYERKEGVKSCLNCYLTSSPGGDPAVLTDMQRGLWHLPPPPHSSPPPPVVRLPVQSGLPPPPPSGPCSDGLLQRHLHQPVSHREQVNQGINGHH